MDQETFKLKIDYSTLNKLKGVALKHLKVGNMNNLRDKFEGQSYLNTFLVRSFSEIIVERFLGFSFIDQSLKESKKGYQPEIVFNNQKLIIVAFSHDELPKIRRAQFELAIFVSINLQSRTAEILGYLDYDDVIKNCLEHLISPLQSKMFIGIFSNLKLLKSAYDLKGL